MKYQFTFRQVMLMVTCGLLALNLLIVLMFGQLFMERVYITQKQSQLINIFHKLNEQGLENQELLDDLDNRNILLFAVDSETYEILYSTRQVPPHDQSSRLRLLFDKVEEALEKGGNELYYVSIEEETYSASSIVINEWITLYGMLSSGVCVSIETACQPVTEAARLASSFNLMVGLLAIAIAIVLMLRLTPQLTDPIHEMSRAAHRIANQDFSTQCETQVAVTEYAELAESLNKMSDEMQKYVAELKAANASLKNDIQEREKTEQARKTLFSNISHDLKTPIAIISGYAEGLKSGMVTTDAELHEYSEVICDEADRMQNLIVRLLELNRLESGMIPLEMEDFDISETMNYLVATFALTAEKKGITIEKSYDEGVYVHSDYTSVEQTLTNLLQNAISHNVEKGHIRINIAIDGQRVRVAMFNTCEPMQADELPKLWDSFYRRDKSRTRSGGESGLGLAIVKGNMEMLKMPYGVRLESGGIVFWLELPYSGDYDG